VYGAGLWLILLVQPALLSDAALGDVDGGAPPIDLQRPAASDAGAGTSLATEEDQEISQNLEMLEHLEESRDLDLLLDLSDQKPPAPK